MGKQPADPLAMNLSPEIRSAFKTLKPLGYTDEQFLQQLFNIALGFHCPHKNTKPYMRIVTDSRGYIDMDATLEKLSDLRKNKETDSILLICTDCMTGKIFRY